jgi:hypothetical protein
MEQSTIREAVAVFDDAEKLEAAVSELQSNGVDRSDLSFLAHDLPAGGIPSDLRQAADDPATPREPVVSDTDLRQGRVLGTGLAATIAAFAAAGFTVATGGGAAATIAAAVAAGWRGRRQHTVRAQTGRRSDVISRCPTRPRWRAALGPHAQCRQ